jgi:hypothetical protein
MPFRRYDHQWSRDLIQESHARIASAQEVLDQARRSIARQ